MVWTLVPSLLHSAPPLDTVEGYAFGPEWLITTHKHPTLPSWMLEASRVLTGSIGWPAYLLSQLCIAATLVIVFRLGSELIGDARAAAGTILLIGLVYFSWLTPEFNHNVAQMPIWAGVAWALWRAVERPSLLAWCLVAVLAAIGVYTKLSVGILFVTCAGWLIIDAKGRAALTRWQPWGAAVLFAALVAPMLWTLIDSRFEPLQYAAQRSAGGSGVVLFALKQLASMAGALVLLAIAGAFPRTPAASPTIDPKPISQRAWMFMLVVGLGPILLMMVVFQFAGQGLKGNWGAPMLDLVGLLLVATLSDRLSDRALKRITYGAAALLLIVPLNYAAVIILKGHFNERPHRVNWPQAAIAKRFRDLWQAETGEPLRIVAGAAWVGGVVAIDGKAPASLMTDSSFAKSPWLKPDRMRREGILVVWETTDNEKTHYKVDPAVAGKIGVERFDWPYGIKPQLKIGYAILKPGTFEIVPGHDALSASLRKAAPPGT